MQRVKKRWQYPPARISLFHDRHLQRLFRLAGAVHALIGHSRLYRNRYHASRLCRSIRVSQSLSTFLQQTLKFFGFVDGKSFGVGSDFCGSVFLWNSRLPVWAFFFCAGLYCAAWHWLTVGMESIYFSTPKCIGQTEIFGEEKICCITTVRFKTPVNIDDR